MHFYYAFTRIGIDRRLPGDDIGTHSKCSDTDGSTSGPVAKERGKSIIAVPIIYLLNSRRYVSMIGS